MHKRLPAQMHRGTQAGLNHGPNGIRRRLNATDRHVKAADYVGQASRRYRRHAAER